MSHWDEVTLVIKPDGINGETFVDRIGIETDYRTRLVARANGIIVIKLPGGKHWSGRGMPQRYHGAEYQVYREVGEVANAGAGGYSVKCERLLDFPARDAK